LILGTTILKNHQKRFQNSNSKLIVTCSETIISAQKQRSAEKVKKVFEKIAESKLSKSIIFKNLPDFQVNIRIALIKIN